jgi:transcriptional regulator with XRE-family HTH domain
MTTLGERLLILRRRRQLTQRELADAAGLNTNTIARLEQGHLKDLGGQSVAKLARALDTTTDFLLGLSETVDRPDVLPPTRPVVAAPAPPKRPRPRKVVPVA